MVLVSGVDVGGMLWGKGGDPCLQNDLAVNILQRQCLALPVASSYGSFWYLTTFS